MPEKVIHNEKLGIIEVLSYGQVSAEDMTNSINFVKQTSMETGISKVLIDMRKVSSVPNITDLYYIASKFPIRSRMAVIVQKEQATKNDLHFAETVARNRGVRIITFTNKREALKWLKS